MAAGIKMTAYQKRQLGKIAYWVAVTLLGLGTIVVSYIWSEALSTDRTFDQAPTCVALLESCDASDIRQVTATVVDAGETSGKDSERWLLLSGLSSAPEKVWLSHGGGVWPTVHPGDTVMVSVWRGLITEVANENETASSQAWDSPDFTVLNEFAGLLLVATPFLAMVVGPAVNRSARMRGTGWFFSVWVVLTSAVYFAMTDVLRRVELLPLLVSVAVAGVLLLSGTMLVYRLRLAKRRKADGAKMAM